MAKNWFDQGGANYKSYRPHYPDALAEYLASLVPYGGAVLDVGCGTGQLTRLLGKHFTEVIGIDPSQDQIDHADADDRIAYKSSPAEAIDLADDHVDLITAAQAAHWFDLNQFYDEVRRVGRKGGVLALISYGVLQLDDAALNTRFQQFYKDEIGPYWPPERKLVDTGYRGIDFPFDEIIPPKIAIKLDWDLAGFLGYLSTWSATRNAREQGKAHVLEKFAEDIAALWGGPNKAQAITFDINMRVGRI